MTKNIYLFLSDNDRYVDLIENSELFKKQLGAYVIVQKGKGHFTAEEGVVEAPFVLDLLKQLHNNKKKMR